MFDGKYEIMLFIKKGRNAEAYRVRGKDNKPYCLKLFNVEQIHRNDFDANGNLFEIEFLKTVNHPNIAAYKDSGEIIIENRKYLYLVSDFIRGETLAECLARDPLIDLYDIRQILSGVLNGLQYLHSLPTPIIHNEITPHNIMLDLSGSPIAKIIDLGNARTTGQSSESYVRPNDYSSLRYIASECIAPGAFSPQSDSFSVGVILYQMLFRMFPYQDAISDVNDAGIGERILEQRKKKLLFPNITRVVDCNDAILNILHKALQSNPDKRFQTATEFLQALNGEIVVDYKSVPEEKNSVSKKGGFAAIAGMQDLKKELQRTVINVIRNPEEYQRHELGLPNGILLYGEPGCGKTFFAECFAEETGFHFMKIKPSDIASIYIHGTQEKIKEIFDKAKEKAPTILYFDEFDAMVPKRDNTQQSAEVNEFLVQLNNIGNSRVFVMASTNKVETIDPAILRSGRLEKKIEIKAPDFEMRKAMFELYLKRKPLDFGINYEKLATLSEQFVSSDIPFVCDEASREAIGRKIDGITNDSRITMEILEAEIKKQHERKLKKKPPVGFLNNTTNTKKDEEK